MIDKEQQLKQLDQDELVQKVYHTDARVTAMEGKLSDLAGGVSRIEAFLLSKPEPNYLAIIGLVAASLFGISEYVSWNLEPMRVRMAERDELINDYKEFKNDVMYQFGRYDEWKEQQEEGSAWQKP